MLPSLAVLHVGSVSVSSRGTPRNAAVARSRASARGRDVPSLSIGSHLRAYGPFISFIAARASLTSADAATCPPQVRQAFQERWGVDPTSDVVLSNGQWQWAFRNIVSGDQLKPLM